MQVVDGMTEEEFAKRKEEQEKEREALEEVCVCVLASNKNARGIMVPSYLHVLHCMPLPASEAGAGGGKAQTENE